MLSRYLFLLLFSSLLFGSQYWKLNSVDGDIGKFATKLPYPVGTTGIVIHDLPQGYSSIVSYCETTSSNSVKFYPFDTLKQENLPHGKWKPSKGDRVRFQENYHRAMIIAKNFNDYLETYRKFKKEWIHPDLFSATLSTRGHRSPLKEDFNYFCKEHMVGLIYIALRDEVAIVDCLSMKKVDSYPMEFPDGEVQKPFYSRIKEIKANWFGEGRDDISDFEKYYRRLIEK